MRLAFIGFRHGHVMGLYKGALAHSGVDVVAACEEDPQAAAALRAAGAVEFTHERIDDVLSGVSFGARTWRPGETVPPPRPARRIGRLWCVCPLPSPSPEP